VQYFDGGGKKGGKAGVFFMGKNRELMGNIIEIFNGFRAINVIHKIFNLYFTAKSIDFLFLVT